MPLSGEGKRRWQNGYNKSRDRRAEIAARSSAKDKGGGSGPTTEKRIHVSLRIKLPTHVRVGRLLQEGISRGTYPWRTVNETYERMIELGLLSLKDSPIVAEWAGWHEWDRTNESVASSRKEAQSFASRTRYEVKELLNIGAHDAAIQLLRTSLSATEEMPPTVWRNWAITDIKAAFPDLVKEIATAQSVTLRAPAKKKPKPKPTSTPRKPVGQA